MTAHKRYTNSKKTRFSWGFIVNIPSDEFDVFGNPKRKQKAKWGYATKKEALEAEVEFLDNLKSGKIELNKNASFSDVMEFFLEYARNEGGYAKGTIANYEGLIKKHLKLFDKMQVSNINESVIRVWRRECSQTNTSAYRINDCIKLLKAAFNYAKKEKQINSNPFEDLKYVPIAKKLRRRFSTAKLKVLFENCKRTMPEFYCIFTLAVLTGMRVGEYSALTVKDIDFDCGLIYVDKQYTRGELKDRNKTVGSTRVVHASDKVLAIVKWHIRRFGIISGFLFRDLNGKPVSSKWMSRKFKILLAQNGYDEKYCRVHDLRGQYVDIMKALGASTSQIAKEVGHSRTSTTDDIYTQILEEVYSDINEKMDRKLFF